MYLRTQTRLCTTGRMLKAVMALNCYQGVIKYLLEVVFRVLDFAFQPLGADFSMRKYYHSSTCIVCMYVHDLSIILCTWYLLGVVFRGLSFLSGMDFSMKYNLFLDTFLT